MSRPWAVVAASIASMMAVLDTTIANVALPTIGRQIAASPAASIWIVSAYQIMVVALLLPLASLGEIVGFRRVHRAGVAIFTLASLGCACAQGLAVLCLMRAMQGVGAACIMGGSSALVRQCYPPGQLGRAVGTTAMVVAVSSALGPTVAGVLMAWGSWRTLFLINLPLGCLSMALGYRTLPRGALAPRRYDLRSATLFGGSVALVMMAPQIVSPAAAPWLSAAMGGTGVVLILLLVLRERHIEVPMIPLDLLVIAVFWRSILTSVMGFAAQMVFFLAVPFALEHEHGLSPRAIGLMMTPWPLAVGVLAPIAGRLSDRLSPALLGAAGMAVMGLAIGGMALLPADAGRWALVGVMALGGVGFGLFQSPNNRMMLGAAPLARAGAAGGMQGTARQLGQAVGALGVALCFHALGAGGTAVASGLGVVLALGASAMSLSRRR